MNIAAVLLGAGTVHSAGLKFLTRECRKSGLDFSIATALLVARRRLHERGMGRSVGDVIQRVGRCARVPNCCVGVKFRGSDCRDKREAA